MEVLFESGLFTELGEVVGCDPVFYEDITKQQNDFGTSSPPGNYGGEMEGTLLPLDSEGLSHVPGYGELDSLLAEGHQLLEQLMADNGLDLPSQSIIDLADLNELSSEVAHAPYAYSPEQHEMLADLERLAEPSSLPQYALVQSPGESISTLASERASPVDLLALEQECNSETVVPPPADLTDLLQSLLYDDPSSATSDKVDTSFEYETVSAASPADSANSSYLDSYSIESVPDQLWDTNVDSQTSSSPVQSRPKKSRSTPYSKLPAGRKERKKKQNKEAAIRYREKKRLEAQEIVDEESQLAGKNNGLKTEVLNLEREIMCMKELLSDVFNIHSL